MTQNTKSLPPNVHHKKSRLRRQLSPIWAVPILALLISLAIAWHNYTNRGELIHIAFDNASGITEGTAVKYRDVNVGRVERVSFTDDLSSILIHARIDKDIAPFLDQDASFWVVRPDVSVRGISGLDTVLSGVYIEGTWDQDADLIQVEFQGLETPPIRRAGQNGVALTLTTKSARAIGKGAPILHKGIRVGYLESPELENNGQDVRVTAFIEAPYDQYINSQTRFWDTSGFSVSVGTSGLALDVDSLASLIEGGIAFETFVSGGRPVKDGHSFTLHNNEESARDDVFKTPDADLFDLLVVFDENISGLNLNANVTYRGIRIGHVSSISAVVNDETDSSSVNLQTALKIDPNALGLASSTSEQEILAFLENLVYNDNLRARMVNDGLLSNRLAIELIEVEASAQQGLTQSDTGLPIIPTTQSDVRNVADAAQGVLNRVNNLPIEELMESAVDLLDSAGRLTKSEELLNAPKELNTLLSDLNALLSSESIQSIPSELTAILGQAEATAENVATLTEEALESKTFSAISNAVGAFKSGTTDLPELITELRAVAQKTNDLQLETLVAQITQSFESLETLTSDPTLRSLPELIERTISDVQIITQQVQQSNSVANMNAAITSAQNAAQGLATAANQLPNLTAQAQDVMQSAQQGLERLPRIMDNIETTTSKAKDAEFDALIAQTTTTLQKIETILTQPATQALPETLGSSLNEVQKTLEDLRAGGAIDALNQALNSVGSAAGAIEIASQDLPDLSQNLGRLISQMRTTVAEYGARGDINDSIQATLRKINDAADTAKALAQLLKRKPNALITGR